MTIEEEFGDAIRYNKIDIIKSFLKDQTFNPSFDDNYPIRLASRLNHIEIIELLLKDPRVDPTDKESISLSYAAYYNYEDLFLMLIKDPRFDLHFDDDYCYKCAIKNENMNILNSLITHKKFLTKDINKNYEIINFQKENSLILKAAQIGSLNIINFILNHEFINISSQDYDYTLQYATYYGHFDIVKFLSNHPKVNIIADNNKPLLNAIRKNHHKIINFLLMNKKVREKFKKEDINMYNEIIKKNFQYKVSLF
jgi:hypothetical protein